MHFLFAIPLFISSVLGLFVPSPRNLQSRATGTLSSWLASESSYALQGVLSNIGSSGSKASGAASGIVVASPSKSDPNCEYTHRNLLLSTAEAYQDFYTWTRDSALVFKTLVDQFLAGNTGVESLIQQYISAQAYLQGVSVSLFFSLSPGRRVSGITNSS